MIKATRKLAKWYRRAEEALTRKQAQKALRKVAKWSKRLAEYTTEVAEYTTEVADERRRESFCARSRGWTSSRGKAARRKWKCADD